MNLIIRIFHAQSKYEISVPRNVSYFELKTFETLYHLIGDQACIAAKTVLFGWIHIDKL